MDRIGVCYGSLAQNKDGLEVIEPALEGELS
jgi:hypothetical protein